jgi:hypothetical protein
VAEAIGRLCQDNARERGEISGKMISRWETGDTLPSLFYQKKLCMLYGKTAQELGFLDGSPEERQAVSHNLNRKRDHGQVGQQDNSPILLEERVVIGTMYGKGLDILHSSRDLYSLASPHALELMQRADVDCFAVDDLMVLTQSNHFAGWNRDDILTTHLRTPLPIPEDIEAIRQQMLPVIQRSFVNSSHYRLATYTPAFSDRRGLEVTLAPLGFHDYYTLIPFLDEPLLINPDGSPVTIREKYGETALTYTTSAQTATMIPAPVALHGVIVTKDQQIILMQRSHTVAFYPNHWSASFEETMDSPGMSPRRDIRPGDTDFFACAQRGLEEEFGIPESAMTSIKVLSLGVEYLILAAVAIAVITVDLSAQEVKMHWLVKAHDKNEATRFATIPVELERVVEQLFSDILWHPTSRMRLIQFLFHTYGVDAVARAIAQRTA